MQVFLIGLFAVLIGQGSRWVARRGPRWNFVVSAMMLSIALWGMLLAPIAAIYGLTHGIDPERAGFAIAPICPFIAIMVLLGIQAARRRRRRAAKLSDEQGLPQEPPQVAAWQSHEQARRLTDGNMPLRPFQPRQR